MADAPMDSRARKIMQNEVSIYFFHTGKGQSILVRLGRNDWIVFDAYVAKFEGKRSNPALEFLCEHQDEEDFRLRAVVLSHFHLDHYLGLAEVIRHFRDRKQLETVVLPATWDLFRILLEIQSEGGTLAPLEDLLQLLDELVATGPAPVVIDAHDYLLPTDFKKIARHKRWIYCLHPRKEDVIKAIGKEGFVTRKRKLRLPMLDLAWIRTQANHFSYVLGVGTGRDARSLHFLLTADVSGRAFDARTREIFDLLPQSRSGAVGPASRLRNLVVADPNAPSGLRIQPLDGLTIPHHGSASDLIGEDTLQWWLDGAISCRDHRPIAVVQGKSSALRDETMDRFCEAGCRVFASSKPAKLGSRSRFGPDLDSRLLGPPGTPREFNENSNCRPGYLAIHGGTGGITHIEAHNFFEIDCSSREVQFHHRLSENVAP